MIFAYIIDLFIKLSLELNSKAPSSMNNKAKTDVLKLKLICFDSLRIITRFEVEDLNVGVEMEFLMNSDWTFSIAI